MDSWKKFLHCLGLGFLVCSAMYLSVATAPFERHDDYLLESTEVPKDCRTSYLYAGTIEHGRPLMAEISACAIQPLYKKFPNIAFYTVLRIINLVIIALVFAIFSFILMRHFDFGLILAIAVSTLVFALPGFQFFMGQALASSNILSLVFASLASLAIIQGEASVLFPRPRMASASFILMILAFLTYQTNAVFFLLFALCFLIFPSPLGWTERRRIILRYLIVFIAATAAYVVVNKFIFTIYLHFYGQNWKTAVAPELSLFKCAHNLMTVLQIPYVYNVWFVTQSDFKFAGLVKIFLGTTAIVGTVVTVWRGIAGKCLKEELWRLLQGAFLFIVLLVALHTVQIFYQPVYYYRVIVMFGAFIAFSMVAALLFWLRMLLPRRATIIGTVIICAGAIFVGGLAQYESFRSFAYVSMFEVDYLETAAQGLLSRQVGSLVLIRPRGNLKVGGDEHGMWTTCFDTHYGLEGIMKRIYRRNQRDPKSLDYEATLGGRVITITDKENVARGVSGKALVNMDFPLKALMLGEK